MDLVGCLEKMVRIEALIKKSQDPEVKGMLRVEYRRLGVAARQMQQALENHKQKVA